MKTKMTFFQYVVFLSLFIFLSLSLTSCGGGGSSTPIADVSGVWNITENVTGNCYGEGAYQDSYSITVSMVDSSLTVVTSSGTFTGTISGDKVSWTGSYQEDGGITTINSMSLTVTTDGNSLTGSANWSWTDGFESCSGTTQITGSRVPGTGPTPGGGTGTIEPLDFFEQDMAHKWSRFHAYDSSTMYYIFKSDRTACYFEITSSSSRVDDRTYVHWELVDNGSNVFEIMVKASASGSLYSIGEFHYSPNEIWKGGYSNLAMYPSSTSRVCN